MPTKPNLISNNSGSVLILVAIFLPIMLALLALALNLGTVYYAQSAYTSIANTATASGLSPLGDEMTKIVNDKIHATPPYIPVSPDIWDNLTDSERTYLTTDPAIVTEIKDGIQEYLNKNTQSGMVMRNDFIIKDLQIDYPYHYNLSDRFVKAHLEFKVTAPISLLKDTTKKDILIKAESQLRIK